MSFFRSHDFLKSKPFFELKKPSVFERYATGIEKTSEVGDAGDFNPFIAHEGERSFFRWEGSPGRRFLEDIAHEDWVLVGSRLIAQGLFGAGLRSPTKVPVWLHVHDALSLQGFYGYDHPDLGEVQKLSLADRLVMPSSTHGLLWPKLNVDYLTREEKEILRVWGGENPEELNKHSKEPDFRREPGHSLARVVLALLRAPGNHLETLEKLGMVSNYVTKQAEALREQFGANALKDVKIFYDGIHPCRGIASLGFVGRALGATEFGWLPSGSGGSRAGKALLAQQCPRGVLDRNRSEFNESIDAWVRNNPERVAVVSKLTEYLDPKKVAPDLLAERKEWLRKGRILALVHNASHQTEIEESGVLEQTSAVSIYGSDTKNLEAEWSGEEWAQTTCRDIRQRWGLHTSDATIYIMGYGTRGRRVAEAYKRLGLPKKNICIMETNRERAREAEKAGYSTEPKNPRPKKAVVIVATEGGPGAQIDAGQIENFGEDNLCYNLSSGDGYCLDYKDESGEPNPNSLAYAAERIDRVSVQQNDTRACSDVEMNFPDQGQGKTRMTIMAFQKSPTLVHTMWQDRFGYATGMSVMNAALTALKLKKSGKLGRGRVHQPDPVLDRQTVALAHESNPVGKALMPLRSLEARSGELQADLDNDLKYGFKPKHKQRHQRYAKTISIRQIFSFL